MPASANHREGGFRADIQGLRAVAVVSVVLYHAHVPFLGGGYVGVDVFFVISGFLITDLLWREIQSTGRIAFGAFYGRRMRRLLPMAMLVLALTMVASAALLPPLQVHTVWKDGAATALYWSNYRFAALQTNYLSSSVAPSPFQQYWSLGVEEQFYLVWPLLLMLAASPWWRRNTLRHSRPETRPWWRRNTLRHSRPETRPSARGRANHRAPSRTKAIVALGLLAAASFGLSYWLTGIDQPWAFFSLPTRAWELAIGGLVALAAPTLRRLPGAALAATGWAGAGAIVVADVVLGGTTPFPGSAALLPALGAAAVVAGGLAPLIWGPVALLGRSVLQLGGNISYSWYLWHWPLLVLAPYVTGHALSVAGGLALAAGSGVAAYVSYVLVEQPARRSSWLANRPWRSLSAGASLSGAGVLTCVVATLLLPSFHGHGLAPVVASPAPAQQLQTAPAQQNRAAPATQVAGAVPAEGRPGNATQGPQDENNKQRRTNPHSPVGAVAAEIAAVEARLAAQERGVAGALQRSAATQDVPANLDPPLGEVSNSEAPPFLDGCLQGFTGTALFPCEFGDLSSSKTAVLFGDSHAAMWFPALEEVANAFHWRLVVWTKATCPPVDISLFSPDLGTPYTECEQWRAEVLAKIQAIHPLLVVLGIAPNYDSAYDVTQDGPAWMAGLQESIESIRRSGAHVLVMGPVESPNVVVPDCLSAHPLDVPACNVAPKETRVGIGLVGYDNAGLAAEQRVVQRAGGWFANVKGWFCAPATCPVIVGNIVVFRDNSHITVQYADFLEPLVASEVELALLHSSGLSHAH